MYTSHTINTYVFMQIFTQEKIPSVLSMVKEKASDDTFL